MKQTKKGFTLVELLVVIAILAILATVSVVGYTAFIQKAHQSNDRTLVAQLNMAVTRVDGGEYQSMQEVVDAVKAQGFDVAKMQATAKDQAILWDMTNQEFFYSADEERTESEIWVVAEEVSEVYSTYYIGSANIDTTASTNICIYTEGTDLTVNAPNANVEHYGEVANLTIDAVASNSYHEHGKVTGLATIKSGRLVVEESGVIAQIVVTSTSVSLEGEFGVVMGSADVLDSLGDVDGKKAEVNNVEALETAEVYNETTKSFQSLADAIAQGGTINLLKDIQIVGNSIYKINKGITVVFDLNGHVLSGVAGESTTSAVITNYGTLTIKDSIGGGKITAYALTPDGKPIPEYASNTITNEATLILESGTIECTITAGGACYAVDNKGVFTMNGGALVGARCALRIAKYNQDNVEFKMNNGTITAPTPAWIQLPGSNAADAPSINVQINGGILQSTKPSSEDNDVIYTYSFGNSHANTYITINGGQFLGGMVSIGSGYKGNAPTLTIQGGTFEYDVVQWLENDESKVLYEANK